VLDGRDVEHTAVPSTEQHRKVCGVAQEICTEHFRTGHGVQYGVQIERNRAQLRATQPGSRQLNGAPQSQNLPAGGRAVAGSNPVSPTQTPCK
jgi:hypothetical protein